MSKNMKSGATEKAIVHTYDPSKMTITMNGVTIGPGEKADTGKNRLELLPPLAILWIGAALTYGASKYAHLPADNWRRVPEGRTRYFGALMRHVFAALAGELVDPESGLPHLAHAGACVVFLLSSLAGDGPLEAGAYGSLALGRWFSACRVAERRAAK